MCHIYIIFEWRVSLMSCVSVGHSKAVRDVCFNNTGTQFLSAAYDRYLKLWDSETGESLIQTHTNRIQDGCSEMSLACPTQTGLVYTSVESVSAPPAGGATNTRAVSHSMGCLRRSSLVPELIVMWNTSLSSFRSVHRPLHQQEGSLLREVQPRWGQTKPVCRWDVGQEDRPGMKRETVSLLKGLRSCPTAYFTLCVINTHTAAVMKI